MKAPENDKDLEEQKLLVKQELARRKHENFMAYCWQDMSEGFKVGLHTREICRVLDDAFERFRNGESVFYVIKVCFRHGKSQISSRFLPPHFLGEFPDKNVMLTSYASSLSEDFSKDARNIFNSEEFQELYPDIKISRTSAGVQQWGVQGHLGKFYASGLSSGITGKGYSLGICDDYCSSRADAESEVIRNSTWEHFTNDFLTRRAPVSITIVLATPWHKDDIIGRIEQKLDPNSELYDPNFPKFKILSFPAMNGEVEVYDKQEKKMVIKKYDYLFPERFSKDWYVSQFASLGEYSSSALMQCSPMTRGGNLIDTSKIKVHNDLSDFPVMKYYRIWDLAHSERQRMKDDPDWTSGTLLTYRHINGVWELWIKDVARIRAKAPERDNFIRAVAEKDGQSVSIVVENSVDSKDAVSTMQTIFNGRRIVRGLNIRGDKVSRMSPVEPIFEAGNVHIFASEWNLDWLNEIREFPSGKHDDQVDNISAGWVCCSNATQDIHKVRVVGV